MIAHDLIYSLWQHHVNKRKYGNVACGIDCEANDSKDVMEGPFILEQYPYKGYNNLSRNTDVTECRGSILFNLHPRRFYLSTSLKSGPGWINANTEHGCCSPTSPDLKSKLQ